MNSEKVVALLSVAFLLFLAFSCSTAVAETRSVFTYTEYGISVKVYAPYRAYPGDYITVRVWVKALVDLDEVTVTITVFGSKSLGYDDWEKEITALDGVDLDLGEISDDDYKFRVPIDSDPGLIYGHIYCEWTRAAGAESHDDSFIMTYLKNRAYEDLQVKYNDLLAKYNDLLNKYNRLLADYNALKADYSTLKTSYDKAKSDYNSLKASYDSLKSSNEKLQADYKTLRSDYDTLQGKFKALDSDYNSLKAEFTDLKSKYEAGVGELGSTRNLMYVFVVTTVVFIATTIIFVVRRPKAIG